MSTNEQSHRGYWKQIASLRLQYKNSSNAVQHIRRELYFENLVEWRTDYLRALRERVRNEVEFVLSGSVKCSEQKDNEVGVGGVCDKLGAVSSELFVPKWKTDKIWGGPFGKDARGILLDQCVSKERVSHNSSYLSDFRIKVKSVRH